MSRAFYKLYQALNADQQRLALSSRTACRTTTYGGAATLEKVVEAVDNPAPCVPCPPRAGINVVVQVVECTDTADGLTLTRWTA